MKPFKTGLICGRFQTFHKGHERLINRGLELCEKLIIMIGSAQEDGSERNPYDLSTRMLMIGSVYSEDEDKISIYGINDMTNENDVCVEWGKFLLDHTQQLTGEKPDLIIFGNDENRNHWFAKEDLKGISQLILNRGDLEISGTQVRAAMLVSEKIWKELVNEKLHPLYEKLRSKLLEVPFYKEFNKVLGGSKNA